LQIKTFSKYQSDALDCTTEKFAVLELGVPGDKAAIACQSPGKSITTTKRIMKSLLDKRYIRRECGKRCGKRKASV